MRSISRIEMPCSRDVAMADPSTVILNWKKVGRSVDVGRFAYMVRNNSHVRREKHEFRPHTKTLARDKFIRRLITALSEFEDVDGRRAATCYTDAAKLGDFIDWLDERRVAVALDSPTRTEAAARIYFEHLNSEVREGIARNNTASQKQGAVLTIFRKIFEDQDWGMRLPKLPFSRSDVKPTEVPLAATQGRLYAVCKALFVGISDLILCPANYPYKIRGPFKTNQDPIELILMANGTTSLKPSFSWDEKSGLPRSYKDLVKIFGHRYKRPRQSSSGLVFAMRRISEEAKNSDHFSRQAFAQTAAYCFGAILQSASGWNAQPLCDLVFDAELAQRIASAPISRQGFREIKFRAKGREVFMELPVAFIPILRTFLQLRAYIVGASKVTTLLVGQNRGIPGDISDTFLTLLYLRLETLGISILRLGGRSLRAGKQDRLIRTSTPQTTADVMGQSIGTTLRAYSNGSAESQREELTAYFIKLETAARGTNGESETAVGGCKSRAPIPITDATPVPVDCASPQGCLFCAQLRLHADERDLRKLLSCRKCLTLSVESTPSVGQDEAIKHLISRIDELTEDFVAALGEAKVEEVRVDVYENGNLDGYWESKLAQLMELGVL